MIQQIYNLLWGDLITIPLPGGSSLGLSLLVILLIPSGIYFTIGQDSFHSVFFPEMIHAVLEKDDKSRKDSISGIQALIVSTACRVGMGNLVGVVAAISAGGAGAVFWMWLIAVFGASTAFMEATLAQIYKEKDPLYGGYRGGPAYYIHALFQKTSSKNRRCVLAVLFCTLRTNLLVRDQPGHWKFHFLRCGKCVPYSSDLYSCHSCSHCCCHRFKEKRYRKRFWILWFPLWPDVIFFLPYLLLSKIFICCHLYSRRFLWKLLDSVRPWQEESERLL